MHEVMGVCVQGEALGTGSGRPPVKGGYHTRLNIE